MPKRSTKPDSGQQQQQAEVQPRLVNTWRMRKLVTVSDTTWRRLSKSHADFPRPIVISDRLFPFRCAAT